MHCSCIAIQYSASAYYAAVLIGRITGLARLFVRLFVSYGKAKAETKTEGVENLNWCEPCPGQK